MTSISILLILISAFMHAGWNILSKKINPTAAFFLLANLSGSVMLIPLLVVNWEGIVLCFTLEICGLIVFTGFFMALYYVSLAGAYRAGDMSVVYPLARSSPAIVVTFVTLVLGLGSQVSLLCIIGIFLIVSGCFFIPIKFFREIKFSNYLNPTCCLALLAAIGTAGYSIIDDKALRMLRSDPLQELSNIELAMVYCCLEGFASSVWLLLFILPRRDGRKNLRDVVNKNIKIAIYAGVAIYLTYILILISFAYVKNVSYVVGFRQLSIPIGVAISIFLLKESAYKPKLMGVAIVFIGLILVAIG